MAHQLYVPAYQHHLPATVQVVVPGAAVIPAVATVNAASGVVTGLAAGNATITYTVTTCAEQQLHQQLLQ